MIKTSSKNKIPSEMEVAQWGVVYMGQFLQGGKNGRLMSFFSTAGVLVVVTV